MEPPLSGRQLLRRKRVLFSLPKTNVSKRAPIVLTQGAAMRRTSRPDVIRGSTSRFGELVRLGLPKGEILEIILNVEPDPFPHCVEQHPRTAEYFVSHLFLGLRNTTKGQSTSVSRRDLKSHQPDDTRGFSGIYDYCTLRAAKCVPAPFADTQNLLSLS